MVNLDELMNDAREEYRQVSDQRGLAARLPRVWCLNTGREHKPKEVLRHFVEGLANRQTVADKAVDRFFKSPDEEIKVSVRADREDKTFALHCASGGRSALGGWL